MNKYAPPKVTHIERENAGAIVRKAVHDSDFADTEVTVRLSTTEARPSFLQAAQLLLRRARLIDTAVSCDDWPDDLATCVDLLCDLQRICQEARCEIDRLKRAVQTEMERRSRGR